MAESRAETWPVPYVSKLDAGGLSPGQSVVVRGVILEGDGFSINFSSGEQIEDGTQLHMNVRPDEKKIVLNSFIDGEWGKEDRQKLSVGNNEPFDIRIRCHDSKFEIFVNQKELCEFDYRTPLSHVNHLVVKGGVELHGINWGGKYYPVPYQATFDHGLGAGKKLYVSGVPEDSPKRFTVNLLNSKEEILLHLNPRFDEKAVVRNSYLGGEWGAEEREGTFPFDKKLGFDLIIANESYAFQIFVNGSLFCAFAHRGDGNETVGVQIQGDVELQGVHVK